MFDDIYVIMLDGLPYRKGNAIRTYTTRERAAKFAQVLNGYKTRGFRSWVDVTIETARFSVSERKELVES